MNKLFLNAGRVGAYASLAMLFGLSSVANAQEALAGQEQLTQDKPAARKIGEATSSLLTIQANGSAAGPALPMLGATSSLSWERYKDSFKYKIPESFERAVSKSNTSSQ
ncbi:Uncharacterized conserved protein [Janthinobacterium sp. Marseille]|nr:DUF3613 domain-containing protein [Janthinobacterium sp. Marseille]ABR91082.1 Uncharacterized conserved protein [Janthinobacterium sp. Marseille]